tara:strand:+ start:333 stop:830 length:498 start_codon:yes stop_codon:yes gene_type:complete
MPALEILQFPDPRLRTIAKPVNDFDKNLKTLSQDMLDTMYKAPGIGLAATQVNVHIQLIVVDISQTKDEPLILVNPELELSGDILEAEEGCLSLPGIYEKVSRRTVANVFGQDIEGKDINFTSEGLLAVCIQHEVDHLRGKVFVDYISSLKRSRIKRKLVKNRVA